MITHLALAFLVGVLFGLIIRGGFARVDRLTVDMRIDPHTFDGLLVDARSPCNAPPPELPATERIRLPPTQEITPVRLICTEGRPCVRHAPVLCLSEIPCCSNCPTA